MTVAAHDPGRQMRRPLLLAGILSSLLYVAMNVAAAVQWPEYRWTSQTISELSAVGAPTRAQWVIAGMLYAALMVAFGIGVRR